MHFPNTVSKNTFETYKICERFQIPEAKIKSYDFSIEIKKEIPKLKEICILFIKNNWKNYPFFEEIGILNDKLYLVDILPCDLPLYLTVPIVNDDNYWRRCYIDKWPKAPKPYVEDETLVFEKIESNGLDEMDDTSVMVKSSSEIDVSVREHFGPKKWKSHFLERYIQEYLENLNPEDYNQEYICNLTKLLKNNVFKLKLMSLKTSTENPESALNPEDHISLEAILEGLSNLVEFSISFIEANQQDNFLWEKVKVSDRDCKLLGNGLSKSDLKIFRILRSDVNGEKLNLFLKPLSNNSSLQILDFSHCKLGDDGAKSLCEVLDELTELQSLILVNNRIGPEAAKTIANYFETCETAKGIKYLNMKLNNIGPKGGEEFKKCLENGAKSLIHLNLSACGLTEENLNFSYCFIKNNTLEKINLSNNQLGKDFGCKTLENINNNSTVLFIDLRMCNISAEMRAKVDLLLRRNWVRRRGNITYPKNTYKMPYLMF